MFICKYLGWNLWQTEDPEGNPLYAYTLAPVEPNRCSFTDLDDMLDHLLDLHDAYDHDDHGD